MDAATLPPIPDMARLQFGQSTCQIEGTYVPVADMNLAAGDAVYFTHHVLLWQDPPVKITTLTRAPGIFANYTTWNFEIDGSLVRRLNFELRAAN